MKGKTLMSVVHKVGFWTRRKSPELLLAGGIVAAGGAIFLAVKATLKLEGVVKQSNNNIKVVKDKMATGEYDSKVLKKDLTKVYAKSAVRIGKLYLPAAAVFGASISALLGSHKIMKGRNAALAAAYTILDNGYKSYRERVARKIGDVAEKEVFRNIYDETKEVTTIDKDGNEKTTMKKVKTAHLDADSDFSYLFDESNPDWSKSGRSNLDFLLGKEKWLNQKLVAQGYLFLNDVYTTLGVEPGMVGERKTQAARVLGWIYDPADDTIDSYVSFGLADKEGNLNQETMDMLRAGERSIYLEFNPDGDILTGSNGRKTFAKYARVL